MTAVPPSSPAPVRVRHHGSNATIEVASAEITRLEEHPSLGNALREIRALGWSDVRIDRRGYRPAGAMAT
jgi:PP-loop superfamily ATP-utilizing enzyme